MIDNRVFLDVRLNGRGPFHFMLDTGAAEFSVRDEITQELRIKVEDAGEESGTGEQKVTIRRTRISTLQIGDLQFNDVAFRVFPGGNLVHVFGTKPFDGILGLEVFNNVTVKHDYVNKILTFTMSEKFNYTGSGVIVHFQRPRQIPVVDAELDGIPGKFGVDTGARSSLLLYGPFVEQNKLGQKYHAKLEGITGWGFGGPIRSQLARGRTLRIGDLDVHDIVMRLSFQKSGLTTSSAMAVDRSGHPLTIRRDVRLCSQPHHFGENSKLWPSRQL
jgi:hypothetical protein